jgi:hypothetical protein
MTSQLGVLATELGHCCQRWAAVRGVTDRSATRAATFESATLRDEVPK